MDGSAEQIGRVECRLGRLGTGSGAAGHDRVVDLASHLVVARSAVPQQRWRAGSTEIRRRGRAVRMRSGRLSGTYMPSGKRTWIS
jgi:hypothetical protein